MRIIISPAKKMNLDTDTLPWKNLPQFLPQAEVLYRTLQSMSYAALKTLWNCNNQIAALHVHYLETMDLYKNLTPAIFAYRGIQYQYMAPSVFTQEEYEYIQEHLRILSALYGLLRPFDGVVPYRLEMQARLKVGDTKDLYAYWGRLLADRLQEETSCIVDLASKEYSRCISRYRKMGTRWITCVFGEEHEGKIVEKGVLCKMARGEMVRYLAEKRVKAPEGMKEFSQLNYRYAPEYSDESTYVFIQRGR